MAEEWFVRVLGKEYGPADAEELRDWRRDGRLLPTNEVRAASSERWFPAGELVEVFADATPPPLPPSTPVPPILLRQRSLVELLVHTWIIYRERFGAFLGLSAFVVVPSVCAQLSANAASGAGELDLRTAVADLFNLAMLVASLIGWPIYLAALQIISAGEARGNSVPLAEAVPRALKFWARVALLCVLVYGAFFLLLVLGFAILMLVAGGTPSLLLVFFALALLALQFWMFSRLFISVLFWQQTAVLENATAPEALRRSRELAYSQRDLSFWQRPAGRGAILASLWFITAAALSIGPEWSTLVGYYHSLTTMQDAQAMLQSMTAAAKTPGLSLVALTLGVVQAVLRPLLGIAFVLLFLDTRPEPNE